MELQPSRDNSHPDSLATAGVPMPWNPEQGWQEPAPATSRNGLPLLPLKRNGTPVVLALVNSLRNDLP